MSKAIVYLYVLSIFALPVLAQEFASTDPEPRNVVLEEFTGIHCGNCPGGHKTAKELADKYLGRVVLISIHEGSYALPGKDEPDFRTKWGTAILNQTSLTGFPAATINRLKFPGEPYSYPYNPQTKGGMAMSVNGWIPAAEDSILNGSFSPVNIGVKTNWNNDNRELEIKVEAYFTEQVLEGAKLNIALLESHIWGPQTGASDPKNYEHNHVLRDLITGQWGEIIEATSKGDLFSKTYNINIDEKYEITNCDLAVFITKGNNKEIYTGKDYSIIEPNIKLNVDKLEINSINKNQIKNFDFNVENKTDEERTFSVTIKKSERTPNDWTAEFSNSVSEFTITKNEQKILQFNVKVREKKGIGDFEITFLELNNPLAKPIKEVITVVSDDINYLEIDCGGSNLNELLSANEDFVTFPIETFTEVSKLLQELQLIVWNFGARGRLDNANADIIKQQFSDGKEILMNGSGAMPTLVNENPNNEFFGVFGINWSPANQIEIMNFGLEGYKGDPVTNNFIAYDLTATNNGYLMQSTTISNPEIAFPMIKMTENDKIISTRIERDNTRAVYLGFNLEVISNQEQKEQLIYDCLNWLEYKTSIKPEYESEMIIEVVQIKDFIGLLNTSNKYLRNLQLNIYNILGEVIFQENIELINPNEIKELNLYSKVKSGIYYILLRNYNFYQTSQLTIVK